MVQSEISFESEVMSTHTLAVLVQ